MFIFFYLALVFRIRKNSLSSLFAVTKSCHVAIHMLHVSNGVARIIQLGGGGSKREGSTYWRKSIEAQASLARWGYEI